MGKRTPDLQPDQIGFIGEQHIFFAATAAPGARVNLSPKGMDCLRVLSPTRILWLSLTGSGNETAAQPGARQVIDVTVDLVQSSCGFAVPFMEYREERPVLKSWAEGKGPEGLRSYWDERNRQTIDGLPIGIEANL